MGKTSLGKALIGEPFDEAEFSTKGVQMIPAIKNAGTGAWRNTSFLEHTTVFDHKVAAKTAEDLLSKLIWSSQQRENQELKLLTKQISFLLKRPKHFLLIYVSSQG